MRRFDVNAVNSGITEYWSSLDVTSNTIDPQIAGDVSGIVFTEDHVTNNRNISRGSDFSIILNDDPGLVSTPDMNDFSIAMLFQPNTSDLWIVKFMVGTDEIGVRINADTSIELVWIVDTETFDEDLIFSTVRTVETESIIYNEDVSYLLLSRQINNVTLTLNGQSVTINGAAELVADFELGGGTGTALVDKISLSTTGRTIPISEYIELFKSQRLDTVPRPDGDSTFNYLLDAFTPEQTMLTKDSFVQSEDYYYANVRNNRDAGLWQIFKRATFDIEYSVDNGETWTMLANDTKLTTTYTMLILRHQNDTSEDFWIEVVLTYGVSIPMSYFTAEITGEVYLPTEVGTGYFDADPGDFDAASVKLTPIESGSVIRSVEALCIINDTSLSIFETDTGIVDETVTTGYTLYVNGESRAFTSLKADQIYHLLIIFDSDMEWIEFNPDKDMGFELVGIGASDVEYTSSDAFYIYNTFVGNPIVSGLEEIDPLSDGVTDSGEAGAVLDIQWDR